MVAPKHLRNAPITEALIDIHVSLPSDIDVAKLKSMHDSIADEYPKIAERMKWEHVIEFKKGEIPKQKPITPDCDGYRYTSGDDKQVVQTRLDGFTFSRLKPYETWEHLRAEAHRLWLLYAKIATPEAIRRVALRYINRLDIPLPIKDFSEYLTASPTVPEKLPQGVSGFFTRVIIHDPSIDAAAIITQALEPTSNPEVVAIILDIDVFKQSQFGLDEKEAWVIIDQLREFKNKIFFESITEKIVELYQ
jgi:uncharacterized protein (TIGR04255 family)